VKKESFWLLNDPHWTLYNSS